MKNIDNKDFCTYLSSQLIHFLVFAPGIGVRVSRLRVYGFAGGVLGMCLGWRVGVKLGGLRAEYAGDCNNTRSATFF